MKSASIKFISYSIAASFYSAPLDAGTVGGGGPPALADLRKEIMTAEPGTAGVFDNGAGDIGLLARGELLSTLSVTKMSLHPRRISTASLKIPDDDFSILSARLKPLDTVGINGENASYRVEAGETPGTITLKDRRKLIRDSVQD